MGYSTQESSKRLKILKTQLYGKEQPHDVKSKQNTSQSSPLPTFSFGENILQEKTDSNKEKYESGESYLRHDLLKISVLATIAIAVQLILFVSLKH